jgi:DNA-binding protein H-NS
MSKQYVMPDLAALSDDDLAALIGAAEAEKKARAKKKVKDLQAQARALAADLGVDVDVVLAGAVDRVPKRARPKYRGPEGQLWSGRGGKPAWIREALEKGIDIDAEYGIKAGE